MKINRAESIIIGIIGFGLTGWLLIGGIFYHIFFPEIALKVFIYTETILGYFLLFVILYFLTKWGFSILVNIGLEPDTNKDKKNKHK